MSGPDVEEYMSHAYASKTTAHTSLELVGLPLEVQDAILAHVPASTLRDVQCLSRHFHHRASRRLWRKLHFKLAGPGDVHYQAVINPQYRLIDALRTITTSRHDYAQYVHDFEVKVIENDSEVCRNELNVATRFLPETDAQKLLSLSLYMLLRNATSLERFQWQVPIEMDTACWKELAMRDSLRRLIVQVNARNTQFSAGSGRVGQRPRVSYQHIAACKALTWLVISEIDDVNHLDDIAACIRLNAGSLKLLKLTFSSSLAAKAKKSNGAMPPGPTPMDMQFDDLDGTSSGDDDIQVTPSSNATSNVDPDVIKKNKNLQENALARMLSVESDAGAKSVEQILLSKAMMPMEKTAKGMGEHVRKDLHELIDKLVEGKHLGADSAQLIDALKDKLDTTPLSRSAKRQKPSSSHKVKVKPSKSVGGVAPYTTAYVLPKSSNTSTLSNPWGAAPPFPQGTSPVAMFGSAAGSPNPLPPQSYSSIMHTGLPPPGSSTNPAHPSNYFLTSGSSAIDPLLAAEGFPKEYQDQYDLMAAGSSFGKIAPSLLATLSAWGINPWEINPGMDQITMKHLLSFLGMPSSGFLTLGDQLYLKSFLTMLELHKENDLQEKEKNKILELTSDKAPPPPPAAASASKSKSKSSKKTSSFAPAYDVGDLSESSESSSEHPASAAVSTPQENVVPDETRSTSYDDMGIDIVHPDGSDDDSADEQEIDDDADDAPRSLKDKGKSKEATAEVITQPAARSLSLAKRQRELTDEQNKTTSPEDTMREWIRKKHGIALEDLQLYLVPLKASVLGRALQLHSLKQIILLSVGGQGPFWQLMNKAQEERPLNLTSIYTDDVSSSFLHCVSKLKGVKCLILRRRSKKATDNTTSKDPASIDEIRKLAVQPHINTLHILGIENSQDQSWCLTQGFIWLLCARGESLRELSFQCGTHRFWEFTSLTEVPFAVVGNPPTRTMKLRLPNLAALHYLGVGHHSRPNGPLPGINLGHSGPGLNGENLDPNHDLWSRDGYKTCHESLQTWAKRRKFAGDTKLKYVGIVNNYIEIGPPKVVKTVPKWLMDDYVMAVAEGAVHDPSGTSTNIDKHDSPFHKWVQEKGYDRWIRGRKSDIKTKRLHECRAIIFSKPVRSGKL